MGLIFILATKFDQSEENSSDEDLESSREIKKTNTKQQLSNKISNNNHENKKPEDDTTNKQATINNRPSFFKRSIPGKVNDIQSTKEIKEKQDTPKTHVL